MLKIYSVESRKGGVGKTTIALNLAKALVKKKHDVLLIDCDITGTPITKAAEHSVYWGNDVVVAKRNGIPYNLIEFYDKVFLRGKIEEGTIIAGLDYNQKKIHLIGSEIYDDAGKLIIDPRDLMDDIHSFWFLDLVKSIIKKFSDSTMQDNKAIVLDNSPGYVGIGRSVREWLTKEERDRAKFVLVSSLDEQDIESTIMSAAEIARMMNLGEDVGQYIKVIINKVPEDLMAEGSGYDIKLRENDNRRDMVERLFPMDKKHYPQNIIKYDPAISGQFIEANIIPVKKNAEAQSDLEGALRTLEKKVYNYEQKEDQFADIGSIDYYYRKFLKELQNSGYVRMSKSLRGDLLPNSKIKNLTEIVSRLGNMVHPDVRNMDYDREELKRAGQDQLYYFIDDRGLHEYRPIFVSLYHGVYKVAGFERKDANLFQMFNLNVMLSAFYCYQQEYYHRGNDYRSFLKEEIANKTERVFDEALIQRYGIIEVRNSPIILDNYISSLLKANFGKFYRAMITAILGMIDCRQDYSLILDACKGTMRQGAKMMSEDLMRFIKNVVAKKTEEPDEVKLNKLTREPYEMKTIQKVMRTLVLD